MSGSVLAVDTSTPRGSIALCAGGALRVRELPTRERHSASLVPMVVALLGEAGLGPASVERWVVGLGPGSYTGVRVALGAVSGLAMPFGRTPVGVSGFDALACQALLAGRVRGAGLLVVADARRGEWYSARYRAGAQPFAAGEVRPVLCSAAEVAEECRAEDLLLVVLDQGGPLPGWTGAVERVLVTAPDARVLAVLGGALPAPPCGAPLEPLYLRPAVFVAPVEPRAG